jgi:hypothetical protein
MTVKAFLTINAAGSDQRHGVDLVAGLRSVAGWLALLSLEGPALILSCFGPAKALLQAKLIFGLTQFQQQTNVDHI